MIFSHVLYQLSYLATPVGNCLRAETLSGLSGLGWNDDPTMSLTLRASNRDANSCIPLLSNDAAKRQPRQRQAGQWRSNRSSVDRLRNVLKRSPK